MKKTFLISALAATLALPALSQADSWGFANDPNLTEAQKQQKFQERKTAVIERMQKGKQRIMQKIDARIECAKNADSPKNMRACHRTYSINATTVEKEHFQD